MIKAPEIILLNSFRNLFNHLRKDHADCLAAGDETKSILYLVTVDNALQRYNLFEQAKTVFLIQDDNPRYLDVNLFFNAERASIPTLHITIPSEMEKNNTIGIGEGFNDYFYDQQQTSYRRTFNRRFNSRYQLVCTSDNSNEVVLIYHVVRNTLISLTEHLNQSGLECIKLSGSDITLSQDIVPINVYARGIGLDFEYNVQAFDLFLNQLLPFNLAGVDSQPIDPDISTSI
mgnify:CR=1 FL=1